MAMREREDLHVKVNERVAWEHTELTAEVEKLRKLKAMTPEPTYAKFVSCGMQTVPISVLVPWPVLQKEISTRKKKDAEGDVDMEGKSRSMRTCQTTRQHPRLSTNRHQLQGQSEPW